MTDVEVVLASFSDEELHAQAMDCRNDLQKAAEEQPESEWHEACFAAMLIYAKEMNRRGLCLHKETMP